MNANRQDQDPYPGLVVEVELREGKPTIRWLTWEGKHYGFFGANLVKGIEKRDTDGWHVKDHHLTEYIADEKGYALVCREGRMVYVERGADREA